jgi:hypothetical protein
VNEFPLGNLLNAGLYTVPSRGEGQGEGRILREKRDPSSACGTFSPLRRGEGYFQHTQS